MTKRARRRNDSTRPATTRGAVRPQGEGQLVGIEPIPFPGRIDQGRAPGRDATPGTSAGDDVIAAFDTVSRRMDDMARALDCFGFFDDDDDDRPRAA